MAVTVKQPTDQEAAQWPREFAIYCTLLNHGKADGKVINETVKKLGGGSAGELSGNVSFVELAKALSKTGEPHDSEGETLGIAVQKAGAEFKPWTFKRRAPLDCDIFLQIVYCGVCHSDIHQARDEWGGGIFPMVPGHELAGIICHVGKDVKGWKVGDKAGVGCFVDSCRECHACQIKDDNYCPKCVQTYSSKDKKGNPTYGGYSSHIVVDYRYVCRIPENLQFDSVAPLLCAGITTYSPLRHYGFDKPGFKLGVVGLGGLGAMAVLQAKAMGADVTVISTSDSKKEEALKRLGADHFIISKDKKAMEAAAGSLSGIIDTVSAVHDVNAELSLLDINGTLVCLGVPDKPMEIPAMSLLAGRKRVGGSMIGGIRETQEMLDFCGKHNIVCPSEIVSASDVTQALYDKVASQQVRYRYVIDLLQTLY